MSITTTTKAYSNRKDFKGYKLGKYDAPLKIQYQRGVQDFKRGYMSNPFNPRTMQYREWERGFSNAYHDQLNKVTYYESATGS